MQIDQSDIVHFRDHLLPRFCYVDSDGNSVPTKDQAAVNISGVELGLAATVLVLVQYRE